MTQLVIGEPRVNGNRYETPVGDSVLWYEFGQDLPPVSGAGPAAVGLMPWALANVDRIHLVGAVDRRLVANLEEYGDYWSMWLPKLFSPVEISADELLDVQPGPNTAVAAFSGGVDGTYQLIANQEERLGARSLPIAAAVLVHGFDIPIEDTAGFGRAVQAARPICEQFRVELLTVRTNWRQFSPDWEMSFAAGVTSALHHYADFAGTGLLAPDEQYNVTPVPRTS